LNILQQLELGSSSVELEHWGGSCVAQLAEGVLHGVFVARADQVQRVFDDERGPF
jgi:hypothetical protein